MSPGLGRLVDALRAHVPCLTVSMSLAPVHPRVHDHRVSMNRTDFVPRPHLPSTIAGFWKDLACRRAIAEVEARSDAVVVHRPFSSPTALARVVLYAGAHGRANALGQLADAALRLRDRPDILIATVGDGAERAALEAQVSRARITNQRVHGPRAAAAMPNKVFDAMATARPILLGIDGFARTLAATP